MDNPQDKKQAEQVEQAKRLAEGIIGTVRWANDLTGYCTCPGEDSHTTRNAAKDCKVYLDGAPTIHCFHQGCASDVDAANDRLRDAFNEAGISFDAVDRGTSKEDELRIAKILEHERLRKKAAALCDRIFKLYPWTYEQVVKDSPVLLNGNVIEHGRLLLGLFAPNDVIWTGDKTDSGQPQHAKHFKTAQEWLKEPKLLGPFTCPSTFKPGTHSRSNDNVLGRPFLVVESDSLDKDQVGAVFRWMDQKAGLPLMAVVDTGGKSLHGWFKFPRPDVEDELRAILPALGCDPGMFRASQPCRLPGVEREAGKYQKLIYLRKENTKHE